MEGCGGADSDGTGVVEADAVGVGVEAGVAVVPVEPHPVIAPTSTTAASHAPIRFDILLFMFDPPKYIFMLSGKAGSNLLQRLWSDL